MGALHSCYESRLSHLLKAPGHHDCAPAPCFVGWRKSFVPEDRGPTADRFRRRKEDAGTQAPVLTAKESAVEITTPEAVPKR